LFLPYQPGTIVLNNVQVAQVILEREFPEELYKQRGILLWWAGGHRWLGCGGGEQ